MGAARRVIEREEGEGPHRTCALTRAERSPDEMIRFVAGPDGTIVPDLARKLPGRGVWVTATCAAVGEAVARKVFARALKRPVSAPPDLASLVDSLLERRVAEAMSLANKAGELLCGFSKVDSALMSGDVAALLHGSDAAGDGRGKLDRKHAAICREAGVAPRVLDVLSIEQMSLAIGRPNVVHAALIKGGAAERVISEAERLRRYRSGFGTSELAHPPAQDKVETDIA